MDVKQGDALVVTTEFRGVFFGYFQHAEGDTWTLTKARNCLYWPAETKGFIGLATDGPIGESRVGPGVDEMTLYKVTAVMKASGKAAERWEQAPWR